MDFESNERDMTGDRGSDQEATLPGANPGMCLLRASQSGASSVDTALPGPASPGTRLPGSDRATVEDLKRQQKKEKIMRRRADRAPAKQKKKIFGTKKEKQFRQQEVQTNV